LLGAEGVGLLGATTELGIYMVLDVCAKVGYGFSLLSNRMFLVGRRQVFDDAIRQSRVHA
jgi:bacteriorhodopsin